MNYHLMIDHRFVSDFITTSEQVSPPESNTYVFTFPAPAKNITYNGGIFAPFGSTVLENVINGITETDKVFIHWFHNPVIDVIRKLPAKAKVYLCFWGGELLGQTKEFFDFNFDPLTKAYLRKQQEFNFRQSPVAILKSLRRRMMANRISTQKTQYDFAIRKELLDRVNFFCHWNKADMDVVASVYGGTPEFVRFNYEPHLRLVASVRSAMAERSAVTVWLGNSDTETNNHLDAIATLSKFSENNLKIVCPLSYGSAGYGDAVSEKGSGIFNSKWTGLRDFVSIENYVKLQQDADVVVMFHNRTQAAGNVLVFLKLGKKVFIKKQSTLYRFLLDNGVIVFDAGTIAKLSFEEFSKPLNESESLSNIGIVSNLFSEEQKILNYKKMLVEA